MLGLLAAALADGDSARAVVNLGRVLVEWRDGKERGGVVWLFPLDARDVEQDKPIKADGLAMASMLSTISSSVSAAAVNQCGLLPKKTE